MQTVQLYGKKAAGRVVQVDDGDYDLVMGSRWNVLERIHPNGTASGPYAVTGVSCGAGRRRLLLMHRLILPGVPQIDHEDGDGLNNQRSNLRPATYPQNHANERKTLTYGGKPTTSRFKGVAWNKGAGKWQARIRGGYLGIFVHEVDAALAYDAAAREMFGPFARLNFPDLAA